MKAKLFNNYHVAPVSKEAYDSFRAVNEPKIFTNRFDLDAAGALNELEKDAVARLSKNLGTPYELRLGLFCGEDLVGWSYGYQISQDTFRMVTSGLLDSHQRKGVYSAFLSSLEQHLKEQGFQVIFSRHYATDNQVIIPKLRFGFLITGMELTDEFGLLLRLSYFFNETRRKALHMRSGFQQADESVKKLVRRYD
ncbi:MAG: hypothetical protein KDD42_10245 [Bdellovibrionales bacterium]|nr:hypothetical protein [Bdellovibrionales bacterium]